MLYLNVLPLFLKLPGLCCIPWKLVRIRYLKWILFCNVLHQPSKTAIRVRFTVPSSPHEFLKVFLQEVRICVPFHPLKFVLCCRPIALCVGQVSVKYRSCIDQLSVKCRSSDGRISVKYRSCIGRVSTVEYCIGRHDYRSIYGPIVGRQSTDYRSTVDR